MKQHLPPQSGSCEEISSRQHYPKKLLGHLEKKRASSRHAPTADCSNGKHPAFVADSITVSDIHIICIYPTVEAGKLARQWIETALHSTISNATSQIESYNYAVLSDDGISWAHVIQRLHPDIILMVSDGNSQLHAGLRTSLRELIAHSNNGSKPLVIFRNLEPEPSINTRTMLEYVSALTERNHCELNAINGNGAPISCFRHPHDLLKARKHHE